MTRRIEKKFESLKKERKKALVLFMTAGDPSLEKNEALIHSFEKEGVDLVELGVPFSDPLADGPVIQAASYRSLRRGTNLRKILGLVERVRKRSEIPLLLMSYLNPVWHYGLERFAREAEKAGVDGLIFPDLPPDEGKEASALFERFGIDLVYLLAPTSALKRQKLVARSSGGFIYYVSVTGVTGARSVLPDAAQVIRRIKREADLPVCVGFGVSTPRQAKRMSQAADGVIVGSAIVKALAEHPDLPAKAFCRRYVRPFARALGK
ncbi:MAG: tryptophan synthase subunit alpha [Candidatus Omnitrophica bacterium]|nr:tryptophan synthase subunit alpha [Candidatus Omnitrophota bacterium]